MNSTLDRRAAVLGLGIIGSRVRDRLAMGGWQIACWNRTPKGISGETATPEAAILGAAVISLYLKDAPATREVIARIEPFLSPGQIVLNHATLDLETTLWLETVCQSRDCRFLDVPFTGSKNAAASGDLYYYIGGDAELTISLIPYLSLSAHAHLRCGGVGSATVVKLATNLISACTVQALAESLAIATHHGVDAACLLEAVAQNACASKLTGMKLPKMIAGDFETHFSLSNMGKDTRYMLKLAESAGLETPAITAVSQRLATLAAAGLGEMDYCAVVDPYLTQA
jgi:3-hydroxyisobutyrate dehydrogenase-like beta-hydroxyacid dehydrogenase